MTATTSGVARFAIPAPTATAMMNAVSTATRGSASETAAAGPAGRRRRP